MPELLGGIAYINLEFRKDRKTHILNELAKLKNISDNVHRIDAFLEPYCGHLGCGKSHIKALELAVENNWSSVLIVEDDMKFLETSDSLEKRFREVCDVSWDVMMLGYSHRKFIPSNYAFLNKVQSSTGAYAYIVRRHYYETLLTNFRSAVRKMTLELHARIDECERKGLPLTKLNECSAIDQEWFSLQRTDCFYACIPQLSLHENELYSDNNCEVDHQRKKIEQYTNIVSNKPYSIEFQRAQCERVIHAPLDIKNYRIASHDGLSYYVNDNSFEWHINNGMSQPYGGTELDIVNAFIAKHPTRNRTYIDVGTHIGTTLLPYSRIFKRAYGYEPNNENFFLAQQNIELNKATNCIVKHYAVSDQQTFGKTMKHGSNSGCFIFVQDISSNTQSIRLDDEGIVDVDFIKLDIEGGELFALNGAIDLIHTYKPLIQIEINGLSEKYFNVYERTVRSFLSELGYTNISGKFYIHDSL